MPTVGDLIAQAERAADRGDYREAFTKLCSAQSAMLAHTINIDTRLRPLVQKRDQEQSGW